jgi:iron(III) transport system permease protein
MGIIWVSGIYFAPFCFLFAVGGLRSMGAVTRRKRARDRSGNFGTAWRITLPLITPAILGSSLLVFVSGRRTIRRARGTRHAARL